MGPAPAHRGAIWMHEEITQSTHDPGEAVERAEGFGHGGVVAAGGTHRRERVVPVRGGGGGRFIDPVAHLLRDLAGDRDGLLKHNAVAR